MSSYTMHGMYVRNDDEDLKNVLIRNGFESCELMTVDDLCKKDPNYEQKKENIESRDRDPFYATHTYYMSLRDYSDSGYDTMIDISKELGNREITATTSIHRYVIGTCDYDLTFKNGKKIKEKFIRDKEINGGN